jgi:hypothetical protein
LVAVGLLLSVGACGGDNSGGKTTRTAVDVGACKYLDDWTAANGHGPPASFVTAWINTFTGLSRTAVVAEVVSNCPKYAPPTTTSAVART